MSTSSQGSAWTPARLDAFVRSARRPLVLVAVRKGDAPSQRLGAALDALPKDVKDNCDRIDVDVEDHAPLMDWLRVHKVPELLVFTAGATLAEVPDDDVARRLLVARTTGTLSVDYATDLLRAAFSSAQRR